MAEVKRLYVEKRPGFDVAARALYEDLRDSLGLKGLTGVRIINRYDIEGLTEAEYRQARDIVFAEPPADLAYDEALPVPASARLFAVEFLPGQYDQTADSAMQCVQLLTQKERPLVATARVILLEGRVTAEEFAAIKAYCINAVECREAKLEKPPSLRVAVQPPPDVPVMTGFQEKTADELRAFMKEQGLAMSFEDLQFCQAYFGGVEKRPPTLTEIKVIDTYWSDHCRHTTFATRLEDVSFDDGRYVRPAREAFKRYLAAREAVYGGQERPMTLMDLATIGAKRLKKDGRLADLDESDEINACSIVVPADVDGRTEEWLVMFKNETHNHPTEIEPFGGAATCLGGAIRDPLSGRSYVYQAMRVTGSADPRTKVEDTPAGKLPQKKITQGAAAGYSSYGNQIGLATGQVAEVYHPGFVAKRMEIGAVIAAAPRRNVARRTPTPGDAVILVGGRTGRDGCGGATGSSKEHTEDSLAACGAEVQKGNAPTERKIQRLFRNPSVSRMIKRCNDFGAGGVSVAIGELADGLTVDLDAAPKKYEGLDGTELAISESQERMAVVVAAEDAAAFIRQADAENLEATVVAAVQEEPRLTMYWRGQKIVDLSRAFLNTNGVEQRAKARVTAPQGRPYWEALPAEVAARLPDRRAAWLENLADLNVCSQKGLVERFDSTIGAATVLMPFGGRRQATPAEGMVARLPVGGAVTRTATAMTYGYNPYFLSWSPFYGALYAVVEAVAKITALGGDYRKVRLTFQEYFEKLGRDETKWGKPLGALLGALVAQQAFGVAAIGGKDSMSGTFKDLHVPPSLVAFAVAVVDADQTLSPEFKRAGSKLVLTPAPKDCDGLPDFAALKDGFSRIAALAAAGKILAAHSVRAGGVAAAVSKMAFGNGIGCVLADDLTDDDLFAPAYGSILLEVADEVWTNDCAGLAARVIGATTAEPILRCGRMTLGLAEAAAAWEEPLEKIFPTRTTRSGVKIPFAPYTKGTVKKAARSYAKPRILIPVFPGTNCEYDSEKAFVRAGGAVETLIIRNLSPTAVEQSVEAIIRGIKGAQIVMLPGGFSAGDEPDGSGKFIAAMFRNPGIKEAVTELLQRRDGLMLGICNGFQALIKLGLLPGGEIADLTPDSPTLTFNQIGRHVSCIVETRVASNLSPWLAPFRVGDRHLVAVSHGEGRFAADAAVVDKLRAGGQIAMQYVAADGEPAADIPYNPNGSAAAIESITSPDGRVLGRMGHPERLDASLAVNVPGDKNQQIFAAGVAYFK